MIPMLAAVQPSPFSLVSGDRVVFYGDSITDQRLYTTYVEAFVRTRYPSLRVQFYARGVGGDCTWGGWMGDPQTRVARDVKPCRPTVITVMLGMNDGGYVPFEDRIFSIYQEWYDKLLGLFRKAAPQARIVLIGSSPFDDVSRRDPRFFGYNATVQKFAGYVESLAAREGLAYVDFNAPLVSFLQRAQKEEPAKAEAIIPDHIHPGPPGHLLMAQLLLASWSADGLVSDIDLDAQSNRVLQAINTDVDEFDGTKWVQTDRGLPFPTDDSMEPACQEFRQALSRQTLRVRNLPKGRYQLWVGDEKLLETTSDALGAGIDLSNVETPMLKQSRKVFDTIVKKNEADHIAWQQVGVGLQEVKSSAAAARAMQDVVRELDQRIESLTKVKPQRYALKKVD